MKTIIVSIILLASQAIHAQQVAKSLTSSGGIFIGFYEYTPADYNVDTAASYPLIIFLHGIGERGNGTNELPKVLANGIPKYINEGHPMRFFWNGKWQTFIVLSPQLSNAYGFWTNQYISSMMQHARKNLRIDTNRVILTGLSLGGGGVWNYPLSSLENAKQVAAIAPVCGICSGGTWCNIKNANLPVWAFHAQDDGTVGAGCTSGAINNINVCNPAVKPYMTIWPTGNHWIWDRAFDTGYKWQNPNLFEWFLGQNKSLPVNQRPVANGGPNVKISTAYAKVNLSGAFSTDQDGSLVRFIWRKISGPSAGLISTPVSSNGLTEVTGLNTTGTYQYELKAVDNRADYSLDTVSIDVTSDIVSNIPPLPKATRELSQSPVNAAVPVAQEILSGPALIETPSELMQTATATQNVILLNAIGSYDPDGTIIKYDWQQVSGPSKSVISARNEASTAAGNLIQGTYVFRLTVWDNKYQPSSTDMVIINGSPFAINRLPVTYAGNDTVLTLPADSLLLDGSGSYDEDGKLIKYQWTFVTGPSTPVLSSPLGVKTIAGKLVKGIYYFKLTTWDNKYEPSQDMVMVKVNSPLPPPNQPPIAFAGGDTSITLPVNTITFTGTASDPDGTIIKYEWKQITGPSVSIINSPNTPVTQVTSLTAGIYYFSITAWDNKYQPVRDVVMLTVFTALSPANKAGTTTTDSAASINSESKAITISNNHLINIAVGPNPVITAMMLRFKSNESGKMQINIYDGYGRIINRYAVEKSSRWFSQQLQLDHLNTGIYMIEVILNNKRTGVSKFYKQ